MEAFFAGLDATLFTTQRPWSTIRSRDAKMPTDSVGGSGVRQCGRRRTFGNSVAPEPRLWDVLDGPHRVRRVSRRRIRRRERHLQAGSCCLRP